MKEEPPLIVIHFYKFNKFYYEKTNNKNGKVYKTLGPTVETIEALIYRGSRLL